MSGRYGQALLYSLAVHVLLIAFLSIPVSKPKQFSMAQKQVTNTPQIESIAVDNAAIEAQMTAYKKQEALVRSQKAKQAKRFQEQLQQAKRARVREEQRLALAKKAKQRARSEALSLAKKRRVEEQRLNKLKVKQAALAKRRADEDKQRQRAREKQKALDKALAEKKRRAEEKRKDLAIQKAIEAAKRDAEARQQALAKAQKVSQAVDKYKALILSAISQNWIVPPDSDKTSRCVFEIRLSPSGEVLSLQLTQSSGDSVLDRSARTAIYKAQPLPVPALPEAFEQFKVVSLTVRPEAVIQ